MSLFRFLLVVSVALTLASSGCSAPTAEGVPPSDRTDYQGEAKTVAPIVEETAPGPRASADAGAEGGECPGGVVEQIPKAGSKTGVRAPVYLGVPGPLPARLPPESGCPKRDVIRNLPGNFPTSSDE